MAGKVKGPPGVGLPDVVKTLQDALASVRSRAQGTLGITLVNAKVTLTVARRSEKKIGGDWKIVSAQLRKAYAEEQELTLTLHPKAAAGALGEEESNRLADAIFDLASAVRNILPSVAGEFELPAFGVSTGIAIEDDGSIQVVAGGTRGEDRSNRIELAFRFT